MKQDGNNSRIVWTSPSVRKTIECLRVSTAGSPWFLHEVGHAIICYFQTMANCDNAYIGSKTTMLGGIYCCCSLYAWLSNSINGAQSPGQIILLSYYKSDWNSCAALCSHRCRPVKINTPQRVLASCFILVEMGTRVMTPESVQVYLKRTHTLKLGVSTVKFNNYVMYQIRFSR